MHDGGHLVFNKIEFRFGMKDLTLITGLRIVNAGFTPTTKRPFPKIFSSNQATKLLEE